MIAKDNEPLNVTNHTGFRELMKLVAPHFKIPCPSTITSRLDDKYVLLRNFIQSQLGQVDSISLTMDVWTEPLNTTSYLGITGHYMVNYEMNSIILGKWILIFLNLVRHSSQSQDSIPL